MARVKVIRISRHGVGGKLLVKIVPQPFLLSVSFPYEPYSHNPNVVVRSGSHTWVKIYLINGVPVGLVLPLSSRPPTLYNLFDISMKDSLSFAWKVCLSFKM